MKNYSYLLFLALIFCFSACQQNSNVTPSAPNNFIEFDENGTTVRYELTTPASHNSTTQALSGTVSTLVNSGYVGAYYGDSESMNISFSSNKSSLGLSDYQNLVGQKIPLGLCTTSNCTQAYIVRTLNTIPQAFLSDASANNLPSDYLKVTSVKFHSNSPVYGDLYEIQGEFNGTLKEDDGTTQVISNGTFQLLFQEY
ncbi:MAG: hypothetical protein ACRBFS_17400 [Aureispira sp.]